MHPNTKV